MDTLIDSCSPLTINKPGRPGRRFGSKGKANEAIRWGIVEAYRRLGGVDGLVKWGRRKPDLFYPMLTKLLPAELAESGAGQQIRVIVYAPGSSEKPLDLTNAACKQIVEAEAQESDNIRKIMPASPTSTV